MFKNCIIYRFTIPADCYLPELAMPTFTPCGPTQEKSSGWIPPRGHANGADIEFIGSHAILKLMIETKTVPAAAIDKLVKARTEAIEQSTGRKPGKKERRELADDARLELLPSAFPKQTAVAVWIDRNAGLIVLDTASQARADEVMTALVRDIEGLQISTLQTQESPTACMTADLKDYQCAQEFDIGRSCELELPGESKSTVRYSNINLDNDEIKTHIQQGMQATRLAMTWEGRVDFVLTQAGHLTKLRFLEAVFEKANEGADNFDTNVAILTGELSLLIPSLVSALGGLQKEPAKADQE